MNPKLWLGATSPFKLMLPAADPTPAQLYAPRGVFMTDDVLVVADSGNHRVLIWHGLPTETGQPADVVLGQKDFFTEGPHARGRGAEKGLYLPTGVGVYEGRLFVADAWHHRILIWDTIPTESDTAPDVVLGQANFSEVEMNRGGSVSATGLYWPYDMAYLHGWFYIADTGNRRVLGWRGIPEPDQHPDLLLGQDSFTDSLENRGAAVSASSFRWPHAIAGTEDILYISDAGNHRILGWTPVPEADRPADVVIGQKDFTSSVEWPYGPQGASALRFPYNISIAGNNLICADTANNRVLLWDHLPTSGAYHAADGLIGQKDFDANGENRWETVRDDTLCWPYGMHVHGSTLAIADSGNNRIILWDIADRLEPLAVGD